MGFGSPALSPVLRRPMSEVTTQARRPEASDARNSKSGGLSFNPFSTYKLHICRCKPCVRPFGFRISNFRAIADHIRTGRAASRVRNPLRFQNANVLLRDECTAILAFWHAYSPMNAAGAFGRSPGVSGNSSYRLRNSPGSISRRVCSANRPECCLKRYGTSCS